MSEGNEEEGAFELLVWVLRLYEKMAYMLRSSIENGPTHGESQKDFKG